jgi:hypothetical protein
MHDNEDLMYELLEQDVVMEMSPEKIAHARDKMLKQAQAHLDHSNMSGKELERTNHWLVGHEPVGSKKPTIDRNFKHYIHANHRLEQAERLSRKLDGGRMGKLPKSRAQAMNNALDVGGNWTRRATLRQAHNTLNKADQARKEELKARRQVPIWKRRYDKMSPEDKADHDRRFAEFNARLEKAAHKTTESVTDMVIDGMVGDTLANLSYRPAMEISNKLIRRAAAKAEKLANTARDDAEKYGELSKLARYHGASRIANSHDKNAAAATRYAEQKEKQSNRLHAAANYRADRQNFMSGRNDIGIKTFTTKSEIGDRNPSKSYYTPSRRKLSSATTTTKGKYGTTDQVGANDNYHLSNLHLRTAGYTTRRDADTSLEKRTKDREQRPDNVPKKGKRL